MNFNPNLKAAGGGHADTRKRRTAAARLRGALPLMAILAAALLVRLNNIGFGLPSLYDPDEPLFMVKAAGLLSGRTLNPHWFGHPATTTIYLTALIQAGVYVSGALAGRFSSISAFVHAAYADPAIIWVPVRIGMAILGTICVGLTYLLGKRLFGRIAGLLAALLLALNALHIAWSQVVRSDVQASDFMLGALIVACKLADSGRRRDAIWAGLLIGFAIATKWPAVTAFAGVIGAVICHARLYRTGFREPAMQLLLAGGAAILGLFIASPFVFIDYPTVLANLAGEARPFHVGHTGHGFLSNLFTYFGVFAANSMGWIGVILAVGGALAATVRSRYARYILLPAAVAFFVGIAAQHLIWSRWLIPGLPYLAIFASAAVVWLAELVSRRRRAALATFALVALAPTAWAAFGQSRERQTDTRMEAARWIVAHARPGSTITLEHLELSLRDRPYRFLFPLGRRGCQDARTLLSSGIRYSDLEQARGGSPVVDLGSVDPDLIHTCRADYVILSYFDEYLRDSQRFPVEVATYRHLLAGGRTVARFSPQAGEIGGPTVRIVALPPQTAAKAAPQP